MVTEGVPADTAPELKERIEAERRGAPFLVYRDGEARQVLLELDADAAPVTVGRGDEADIVLSFDGEVSRVHAELGRIGGAWAVIDDGLSRNGTFVNGERVVGRRRLRDGDALRFGNVVALYRSPGEINDETVRTSGQVDATAITDTQRRVLIALCRPFGAGSEFATPAPNKEIAEEVFLSVDAVKANLRALFDRFEVGELAQNQKRVRLAELAMRSGVISLRDLESRPGS
jgi:pSer/pThr/pTyr-binding forkhead associated (FHA) protein